MHSIARVLISGGLFLGLSLGLAACQTTSEKTGSGPIRMSPASYETYQIYVNRSPLVFALTEDGEGSFYIYCSEVGCDPYRNVNRVLERCTALYDKPCRIWAIRDEIVWANPGDWVPSEAEIAAAYKEAGAQTREDWELERRDRLEEFLADKPYARLYHATPGHKAMVVFFNPDQRRVHRWGYVYGRTSAREAVERAHRRCSEQGTGGAYLNCEIYDVNGVRAWPMHIDDVTDEQWDAFDAAVADVPVYEGRREIEVTWDGLGEETSRAAYSIRAGVIRFAFLHSAFEDECTGEIAVQAGSRDLAFSLRCGLEADASGGGSFNRSGTEASLNGTDGEGRDVRIYVGPDPVLAPPS